MNYTNITDIYSFLYEINAELYGFLPFGILLLLFAIGYTKALTRFPPLQSIFITLLFLLPLTALFVVIKLLDAQHLVLYLLLLGISAILLIVIK